MASTKFDRLTASRSATEALDLKGGRRKCGEAAFPPPTQNKIPWDAETVVVTSKVKLATGKVVDNQIS